MFRWVCLGVATIATAILLWMVNDVRTELQHSTRIVNENLPLIFARTQRTTETLVALSDDIRQIRNLTGATCRPLRYDRQGSRTRPTSRRWSTSRA